MRKAHPARRTNAMAVDISPRRVHVREHALAFDNLQMHQFAGRVVYIDQQGTLLPARFKPPVLQACRRVICRAADNPAADQHPAA